MCIHYNVQLYFSYNIIGPLEYILKLEARTPVSNITPVNLR